MIINYYLAEFVYNHRNDVSRFNGQGDHAKRQKSFRKGWDFTLSFEKMR